MIGDYPHKKNVKIAILVYVLFLGTLYFMTSCTSTKIKRQKLKKQTETETVVQANATQETNKNQNKQTSLFDRSLITENDFSIKLTPIDPLLPMQWATNPQTGVQEWQNAIPEYQASTKETNTNTTQETEETTQTTAKATTEETAKASAKETTEETNKEKEKFSLPWYSWFFMGFFLFGTILWIIIYISIKKQIKQFIS